eukprot:TRINITY_DN2817_c0_g1_i5.p2 TRINITY_DN2817_c0_g1~~TRINITY_DN2817_c0_g1_i5.p2  ORF type:complete len:243 (+),score=-8.76 TRINITY_DN2817_c0_g1_i5:265-993(+)
MGVNPRQLLIKLQVIRRALQIMKLSKYWWLRMVRRKKLPSLMFGRKLAGIIKSDGIQLIQDIQYTETLCSKKTANVGEPSEENCPLRKRIPQPMKLMISSKMVKKTAVYSSLQRLRILGMRAKTTNQPGRMSALTTNQKLRLENGLVYRVRVKLKQISNRQKSKQIRKVKKRKDRKINKKFLKQISRLDRRIFQRIRLMGRQCCGPQVCSLCTRQMEGSSKLIWNNLDTFLLQKRIMFEYLR